MPSIGFPKISSEHLIEIYPYKNNSMSPKGPNPRGYNGAIDVPWDHHSFNLGNDVDLQPPLRKKVEIIETEEGFCMFYPKHRQRKSQSKAMRYEVEEREPNMASHADISPDRCDGSSGETTCMDAAMHCNNTCLQSRQRYSLDRIQKRGQNVGASRDLKKID